MSKWIPVLVYEGNIEADFPSRVVMVRGTMSEVSEVVGDAMYTSTIVQRLQQAGLEYELLPEVLLVSDYNGPMRQDLVTEVGDDPYIEEV
jgi:hypothetical protein